MKPLNAETVLGNKPVGLSAHPPMSQREFFQRTGRLPEQDELERVNCPLVGLAGHSQCGWCEKCNAPRFMCSHLAGMEHLGKKSSGPNT